MNSTDRGFVDFVLDQLSKLDNVSARSMFGGFGLYRATVFFGIVYDGSLYLKTNATTRSWYEDQEAKSFKPTPTQHLKNYLEVPPDAIEDREELVRLAEEASELT